MKPIRQSTTRQLTAVLAICMLLCLTACGKKVQEFTSEPLTFSSTDYSDPNLWLRFGGDNSSGIDIFAVYPTVAFIPDDADKPYVRIDSPVMRERAESVWFSKVDEIIMPNGNVYAPLYGQLNGLMLAELSSDEFESYTNANPRDDVFAAFDYYLTNINKGERPFILFGHSQGASLVTELATVFLGNEKYIQHNKNHIITYAVGYSVTQEKIDRNPNLKFSQSPTDTGVIVSWNTTAQSEIESGAYKTFGTWNAAALVTNPISWTTDETIVPASSNKASLALQPDGTYKRTENYADARADKEHHVLVVTTVDEALYGSSVPNIGMFHQYDITLFHDSVKQNVKDRIAAFQQAGLQSAVRVETKNMNGGIYHDHQQNTGERQNYPRFGGQIGHHHRAAVAGRAHPRL